MPFSYQQCQAFAAMAKRGEKVPKDWREHCRGVKEPGKKPKAHSGQRGKRAQKRRGRG